MKLKSFITLCLLVGNLPVMAQQTGGYCFPDFTPGRVILKNRQFARGTFNYDFVNHQMHFMNGKTDMIVENLEDIDTILIDQTRFIPYEKRFVEVVRGKQSLLLLDRKVTAREQGKTGAMGLTTQGSVQAIDVNTRFMRVNGDRNLDLHVYKDEIQYTYYILVKKKWKPFHNQITFLQLCPKKEQESVKNCVKELNTDFRSPDEVIKLLDALSYKLPGKVK